MSTASKTSDGTTKTNGTVETTAPTNGVGITGCGYKHYNPPRKLRRKLIGMIYE
jgi:hypothetical protein